MKFKVNDILNITGGELLSSTNTVGSFSISTDSRTINSDNIYLPLAGANFDGHNFIDMAVDKGCRGYFISKKHIKKYRDFKQAKFAILVDDTLEAYHKLANHYRKQINPIVIAVTGSSGKTTTKEMIYSVISKHFKTHKSKLNHNNEIGLCQTLLQMEEDTQCLVVEMGMRGLGEIELLSKYAQPDIAIITNVGTAHIGRLGSIKNIAKAKAEIIKYLNKEGTLIAFDDINLKQALQWNGKTQYYSAKDVINNQNTSFNTNSCKFEYEKESYELNVTGEHNIVNSIAAIKTAKLIGLSSKKISEGLKKYRPIDNREQVDVLRNGTILINDSYNANPDSVQASIEAVLASYKDKAIKLVLGYMAELGSQEDFYHTQLGKLVNKKNIAELITIGEKSKLIAKEVNSNQIKVNMFDDNKTALAYIKANSDKNTVFLLKASRCMEFDKLAEEIKGILQ